MQCKNKRVIVVATKSELLNEHYYRRLWLAARNISIPRRGWLDEIADCFCQYRGSIIYRSGEPFPIYSASINLSSWRQLSWPVAGKN